MRSTRPFALPIPVRRLARRPVAPALALTLLTATLAGVALLGAVLRSVVLESLPFEAPDELYAVWRSDTAAEAKDRVTAHEFLRWSEETDGLISAALLSHDSAVLEGQEPVEVAGSRVSEGYFRVLGVRAARGRVLVDADHEPSAEPVAVVSHSFWASRLGSDPAAIGSSMVLDGTPVQVVGVLAPRVMPLVAWHTGWMEIGDRPFVWRPQDPRARHPWSGVHGVVARFEPGLGRHDADARLETVMARIRHDRPERFGETARARAVPLADEAHGDVRSLLTLLAGAVLVLLVVAAADLTILGLLQRERRRPERSLRLALGATPRRLALEGLARAATLGLASGFLAWLSARAVLGGVVALSPVSVPRLGESRLDLVDGLALFVAGMAVMLLVSLAVHVSDRRRVGAISPGTRARVGVTADGPLRKVLVGAQAALAVFLVLGAALLVRSWRVLEARDPGFRADSVLVVPIAPRGAAFEERASLVAFFEDTIRAVEGLPGVRAAAAAYDPPSTTNWTQSIRVETPSGSEWKSAAFRTVTPGTFRTLGIPLLRGRDFEPGDTADRPGVAIVNEAFVRRHLAGGEALGARLAGTTTRWRWGDDAIPSEFEIVGVVRDVRFRGVGEPAEPAFYLPFRQTPHGGMVLLVRTDGDELGILGDLRALVARSAPGTPLGAVTTLRAELDEQLAGPRFGALVLGLLAVLAGVLAALGLWGVLDATVRERTREIGLRMALGSDPGSIARWALRQGLLPAAAGLVAGVAGAVAARQAIRGLLVDVGPADPLAWTGAALACVLLATAATVGPTWRAARVDPATSLRAE